ncbi:MAG: precorrin-8X methylmutase, partial [Cyanobacteriota bacterium]
MEGWAAAGKESEPGQSQPGPLDHPIFVESVRRIRGWLGPTGLEGVEQEVLERLVHSSGDLAIAPDLRCSPG